MSTSRISNVISECHYSMESVPCPSSYQSMRPVQPAQENCPRANDSSMLDSSSSNNLKCPVKIRYPLTSLASSHVHKKRSYTKYRNCQTPCENMNKQNKINISETDEEESQDGDYNSNEESNRRALKRKVNRFTNTKFKTSIDAFDEINEPFISSVYESSSSDSSVSSLDSPKLPESTDEYDYDSSYEPSCCSSNNKEKVATTITTKFNNNTCDDMNGNVIFSSSSEIVPSTTSSSTSSCRKYERLPLEYWERSEGCKEAKYDHMDRIDRLCASREKLVLETTLWYEDTVLEPNMFPYNTPLGIEHYTLWSIFDLTNNEISNFVENWLEKNMPQVRRWEYDDNSGDRSIELFHVHVFIETDPFSFQPTDSSKSPGFISAS
eukprot:gene8800-18207_t